MGTNRNAPIPVRFLLPTEDGDYLEHENVLLPGDPWHRHFAKPGVRRWRSPGGSIIEKLTA